MSGAPTVARLIGLDLSGSRFIESVKFPFARLQPLRKGYMSQKVM